MPNPHDRVQPSGKKGAWTRNVGNSKAPEKQAEIRYSADRKWFRAINQAKLDRWSAATEELDAKYIERRAKPHAFRPMGGTFTACDWCAAERNDHHDGKLIHIIKRLHKA